MCHADKLLNLLRPQFGIVLDAGSSHTNLYIYKWPAEKENDTGVVHQLQECQVKGEMKAREVGRMGLEGLRGSGSTQEQRSQHRDKRGTQWSYRYFMATVK